MLFKITIASLHPIQVVIIPVLQLVDDVSTQPQKPAAIDRKLLSHFSTQNSFTKLCMLFFSYSVEFVLHLF